MWQCRDAKENNLGLSDWPEPMHSNPYSFKQILLRYFSSWQRQQFVPSPLIQHFPASKQPQLFHLDSNKVTNLLDQGTTPVAGADNFGLVGLWAINELCKYINFSYSLLWKGISGLYYLQLYPWQCDHSCIFQTRSAPGSWHSHKRPGLCPGLLNIPQKYVSQMGWSLKQTGKWTQWWQFYALATCLS